MTQSSLQKGFGHVAVVFLLVFLAVAGFAGYKVVASHGSDKTSVASAPAVHTAATVPDMIKSKADLVQTSKVLDNSSTTVNASLNDNSLNGDLNDML